MNNNHEDKCTMIYQGVTRVLETGEVVLTGLIEYPKGARHMTEHLKEQYQGIIVYREDWDMVRSKIKEGDILAFDLNTNLQNITLTPEDRMQPGREKDNIYVLGAESLDVIKPNFDNVVKFPVNRVPKPRPL